VFVDEQRERFGVEPICRTLGVSASAYYQRATGKRSARRIEDARLLELIREVHAANYFAYGSWRMWRALLRAGEQVGRGRVERLMRTNGIQGAKRRGKPWRTTYPDAGAHRPADLVERDFSAGRPDELWFADFTYLRCWEGVVYFAFVIDAYSRAIVGWQFAAHMRTDLVLDALRMALAQRGAGANVALVHHSDAGSQYNLVRLQPDPRRPRRARLDLHRRGCPRQRGRGELRRQLQDRADPRPCLAQPQPARARRRRVRRLVQQRAHPYLARRRPSCRVRTAAREAIGSEMKPSIKVGNQSKPSPRNPGWLRPQLARLRARPQLLTLRRRTTHLPTHPPPPPRRTTPPRRPPNPRQGLQRQPPRRPQQPHRQRTRPTQNRAPSSRTSRQVLANIENRCSIH
jgi:putative transposase